MKKGFFALTNSPEREFHLEIKQVLKRKIFSIISAYLLGILFAYAAVSKLVIYETFISQLHDSPVTKGFETFLAWFVPSIELVIACLLFIPKTRLAGLWSSLFLMFIFTIYVFSLPFFFRNQIPCSCGGIISDLSWGQHFWFNIFFTVLAGLAIIFHKSSKQKL